MQSKSEGSAINICVADFDTIWMMEITQDLQTDNQIKVIGFAQTGQALIERVVQMNADAVLMTYALPDITAAEVAKRLAEESPGTAVFAVSSSITAQLVQTAKAVGVIEIFPKEGFVAREAAARIKEHVDGLRREWANLAQKYGVVERGTGPKGEKIRTEYVTRTLTQTVVLTYNTKGGVGKSTIAVNLAMALKLSPYLTGQRIVLVDFDCGSANVATICHIPDAEAYNKNLAVWEHLPEDLSAKEVDELLIPGPRGLMIAAAPLNQAIADRINHELADKILRMLRRHFGIIIIDGAPNISPPVDAALNHATHILLIANPEGQSVRQLARTVQLVQPDQEFPEKPDLTHILRKMFIVMNHAQADSKWDLKADDVARSIGRPLIANVPHDDVVRQALHSDSDKQAVEINEVSPFTTAIKQMANDICGAYPQGIGSQQKQQNGGLFRLFKRRA